MTGLLVVAFALLANGPDQVIMGKLTQRDGQAPGLTTKDQKLVALDVWWGRILSTALVLDVESGKWLYAEEADYSEMIQPCEGEQSKPGALNRPIQQ